MVANRNYGFKKTADGYLYSSDYLLEVARGLVPGHRIVNKFGYNPDIDTNTDPEDNWSKGGTYNFFPATAKSMRTNSTSTADVGSLVSNGTASGGTTTTLEDSGADFVSDGVAVLDVVINDSTGEYAVITNVTETVLTHLAMSNASQITPCCTSNSSGDTYRIASNGSTGAGVIQVFGLDENWDVQTETVILNGQNYVNLQKDYIRMHRAFVIISSDEENGNIGSIQIVDVGDATAIGAYILAGSGQTEQNIMSIPRGKTGYFLQGYVGMSRAALAAASMEFVWKARTFGGCFRVQGRMLCINLGSGWWQYSYKGSPGIPTMSDVKITCLAVSANDMSAVGGIDMLLIDDGAA